MTRAATVYSDILDGGSGKDYLEGSIGNDRLYGGSNSDTIYGGDGNDRLNVHNTGLTTFAQVQAAASAYGPGSTLLDFGAGNKMVLYNFALGNLDASDIIF